MNMTRFGQAVRTHRKALGKSSEQIARCAGVGRSTVTEVETGKHTPRLDVAASIAAALGVPLDALIRESCV